MIRLHPIPGADYLCPYCQVPLAVKDWYIPGMRTLAYASCPECRKDYYADLPAGHGLLHPVLLERESGKTHDPYGADWFAKWLRDSYARRVQRPILFQTEDFRPLRKPILLNCLDALYGHSLLKLLNAQYYIDHRGDLDLVILIPRNLRWLVPEGVASVWTLDLPLSRGTEWNDWVAMEIKGRLEAFDECWLSLAISHPHPRDFSIERFTRVKPFPVGEWGDRLEKPAITFAWREDRPWWNSAKGSLNQSRLRRLKRKILGPPSTEAKVREQKKRVIALAETIRRTNPRVDFAVAGIGTPGGFPGWVSDMRVLQVDEDTERIWCERYSRSHVVVGVHGSNLLLPSAHAGAVLELVPPDRWSNLVQDILVPPQDVRSLLYRTRFLPLETPAGMVAEVLTSMLQYTPEAELSFTPPWTDHKVLGPDPWTPAEKRRRFSRNWGQVG
jgi:hypothetical protein